MSNDHQFSWQYLMEKYSGNSITKEELEVLLSMARAGQFDEAFTQVLEQQWEEAKAVKEETGIDWDAKLDARLLAHKQTFETPVVRKRKWFYYAAAVLLFAAGTGIFFLTSNNKSSQKNKAAALALNADTIIIQPGSDGAVLTLSDGRSIVLDSAGNGLVATQGDARILNNSGCIRYDERPDIPSEELYNKLTTAKGKQFHLVLSDGTKVWLNAASSIRYPTVFTKETRRVQITGEAYFEVAHTNQKKNAQPFVVQFTNAAGYNGEVQVLGTHFNINAYNDEAAVKTTLLEGKVKVALNNQSVLLAPGQQAAVNKYGRINTAAGIDMDAVVAWKNGYFSFNETDMPTMMRQISRWYDVEIEYAGAIPQRRFGGEISRNSNATQVLKIMEESEVHFKISGKKIIVLP